MMKKILALLTALMVAALCTVAPAMAEAKKISVVTTIFPVYDWTREIIGDSGNAELTMLLDSGVDLHSYQPTAMDIMKVATCDVFIYVGGESDAWVKDALSEAVNRDMIVINLMEALGEDVKEEEIVEGMEEEHDHGKEHDHDDEKESDEHIWLSLRNAEKLVRVIAGKLGEADPAGADTYQANAVAYETKLKDLDQRYQEMAGKAAYHTVLFGDRFPFRYLVDDYGLEYYAAFSGCSAETEASFQTIVFLAGKMDEMKLPAVLCIEGTNHRIAETIINATQGRDQKLLAVNSMQGTTKKDAESGTTYLGLMESNLAVFENALNK